MPTFQFKKLVRDNIAQWHVESGHEPTVIVLQNRELQVALCDKLHEEADEVHSAATREELIEEIADVQQIIDDLLVHSDISVAELKAVQTVKRERKGGFSKGIYIEKVYMPNDDDKWAAYCRKNPEKYPEL